MTRRTERVSEEIRAELARLLREEAGDPRLGLVTLTRVDLSPDFHNARVYWSSPRADDEEGRLEIEAGLTRAAGFLKHRLAGALVTKRVPELEFRHDPSLALATRTLSLLKEVSGESEE